MRKGHRTIPNISRNCRNTKRMRNNKKNRKTKYIRVGGGTGTSRSSSSSSHKKLPWNSISVWDPARRKPFGFGNNYGSLQSHYDTNPADYVDQAVHEGVWEMAYDGRIDRYSLFREKDKPEVVYNYLPNGTGDQPTYDEIYYDRDNYVDYDPIIHNQPLSRDPLRRPLLAADD